MQSYKGTYILIGAAAGYISGGPIYHRNKAIYMQKQGWQVYYISCSYGKVYINGLEQFMISPCTFIYKYAYLLPTRVQNKLINYIIERLPIIEKDVVIETGTDFTAYWGELLAQRLRAKHVVILLDEYNNHITNKVAPFFKYKFDRNELACIQKRTMMKIFGSFWNINDDTAIGLPCYCTNALEDFTSDITEKIVRSKYNIGYIGRLEKNAMPFIIDGIKQFATKFPHDSISFICFGGAEKTIEKRILSSFSDHPNVRVFISGFIFPIPKESVCKCDIFFSVAGSASVSLKAGLPTVRMDMYSDKPIGFLHGVGTSNITSCPLGENVVDYLIWFFKQGYRPNIVSYNLSNDWDVINNYFKLHDYFIDNTSNIKAYYDFSYIHLSWKERWRKFLVMLFGLRMYKHIASYES